MKKLEYIIHECDAKDLIEQFSVDGEMKFSSHKYGFKKGELEAYFKDAEKRFNKFASVGVKQGIKK